MALSQSPALIYAGYAFASIWVSFGINAMVRPTHALTFFEFEPPKNPADRKMVDSLMAVYGARDIFMGAATYISAIWGGNIGLGWMVIAGASVAFVDGLVCWRHGKGQMNHWGYAPIMMTLGAVLLGAADSVVKR